MFLDINSKVTFKIKDALDAEGNVIPLPSVPEWALSRVPSDTQLVVSADALSATVISPTALDPDSPGNNQIQLSAKVTNADGTFIVGVKDITFTSPDAVILEFGDAVVEPKNPPPAASATA